MTNNIASSEVPFRAADLNSNIVETKHDAYAFAVITILGSQNNDLQFTEATLITGFNMHCTGIVLGDYIACHILDSNHSTVLITPIKKAYLVAIANNKEDFIFDVPAVIPTNGYFRIVYNSTNILSTILAKVNIRSHKLLVT